MHLILSRGYSEGLGEGILRNLFSEMEKFQKEEIAEFMNKLQTHKNVVGSVFVNKEGLPIATSMEKTLTDQYSNLMSELSDKAQNVIKGIDSTDELTFIRMHTKKHEIMIAPDPDKGFRLVVVQAVSK